MAVSDNRRSRVFPDPRTNRALSRSTHCVRYPGFFALLPASGCTCRVSIFCRRRTRKHTHTHTHTILPSGRACSRRPVVARGAGKGRHSNPTKPNKPNKTNKPNKPNKPKKTNKQNKPKTKQTKLFRTMVSNSLFFLVFGFWGVVCVFGVFLCLLVSKSSFQSEVQVVVVFKEQNKYVICFKTKTLSPWLVQHLIKITPHG